MCYKNAAKMGNYPWMDWDRMGGYCGGNKRNLKLSITLL